MLLILGRVGFRSPWALWKFNIQPTIIKPWRTAKSSFIECDVHGYVRSFLFHISLWSKWLNKLELCHLVRLVLYNRLDSWNERIRCSYEKIKQIECPCIPISLYFLFINKFGAVRWNKIIFNRARGRTLAFFQYMLTLSHPIKQNSYNYKVNRQTNFL